MNAHSRFESIIDEFAEQIFNHAWRMLGSREDAEEVTQDVFLRIHRSLDEFRGDAKLSTWIWRITTNLCLTRRATKRPPVLSLDDGEDPDRSIAVCDPAPDPAELFAAQETREELAHLISLLNPVEASAITLFYLDQRDYEEIARIMDMPMGSVATALHRGRNRLRRLYERKEYAR